MTTQTKPPKICPTCHVDRGKVAKMVLEGENSENYWTAHYILENCPDCKRTVLWVFESLGLVNEHTEGN